MICAGSVVITSGRLGRVVRPERSGAAVGFLVTIQERQLGDGYLPHWAPANALREAVIGRTVCDQPSHTHWCGLVHLPSAELAALRAVR